MIFTVYILYSYSYSKIYIGITSNLIQRFYSHNLLSKSGYTIKFRPWTVIYCEHVTSRQEALAREKKLKSGIGREIIHKAIEEQLTGQGYINLND